MHQPRPRCPSILHLALWPIILILTAPLPAPSAQGNENQKERPRAEFSASSQKTGDSSGKPLEASSPAKTVGKEPREKSTASPQSVPPGREEKEVKSPGEGTPTSARPGPEAGQKAVEPPPQEARRIRGRWLEVVVGPAVLMVLLVIAVLWLNHKITSLEERHDVLASRRRDPGSGEAILEMRFDHELRTLNRDLQDLSSKLTALGTTTNQMNDSYVLMQRRLNEERTQTQEMKDTLEDRIRDVASDIRALGTSVDQLRRKNIDTYFDEWKQETLQAALKEENQRTLQEFKAQVENAKTLQEHRQAQERIREKVRAWFDGLGAWVTALRVATTSMGGAFLPDFSRKFSDYCECARRLVWDMEVSLSKFDLASVSADVNESLSFMDVVSGRSGESITNGYRHRLVKQLEELKQNTATFTQEWEKLRVELLVFLDQFYGQLGALEAPETLRALDATLRVALGLSRVQEIPVEPNQTAYDPSVHEPVAGARPIRPDLPENTIVSLERRGFFHEGKVLRRALVTLSARGK